MKDLQLTERIEKEPNSYQIRQVSTGRSATFQVTTPPSAHRATHPLTYSHTPSTHSHTPSAHNHTHPQFRQKLRFLLFVYLCVCVFVCVYVCV